MREVVIGVFRHSAAARRAIEDLCDAGFEDQQIGLLAHAEQGNVIRSLGNNLHVEFTRSRGGAVLDGDREDRSNGRPSRSAAGELAAHRPEAEPWAVRVFTCSLPAIGSVVMGGLFAPIMEAGGIGSDGDGAGGVNGPGGAAAGAGGKERRALVDGLIAVGITKAEALHYVREFARGRSVILVQSHAGAREVLSILGHHRSFERSLFRVHDEEQDAAAGSFSWS